MGTFSVTQRQSELKISEANAGAKSAKCTACHVLMGQDVHWTKACVIV